MSYERNVSMEIIGEIADAGVIEKLAVAMQDFVQPDYDERSFSFDEAVEYILESIRDGQAINVYRNDTSSDLDDLKTTCRECGLAYRMFSERSDHASAYVAAWAPGFDSEQGPQIDDDFRPVLPIEDIKELLAMGADKLQARIDEVERDMAMNIPTKVTASEETVLEAMTLLEGEDTPSP